MARTRSGRVFISHSSEDAAAAAEICRAIEQRGVRCVIAPRDVPLGVHYTTWIGDEVRKAAAFVLVVSSHSQKSKAVLAETEIAFNNDGCPIYPVRIELIEKRDLEPGLLYLIGQSQMFDAIKPIRDSSLRRLSKSVASDVLGRKVTGGGGKTDPLGRDGPYFRKLWARMDAEKRSIGWLWEAAMGGPLWCFYRGMTGLGYTLALGLALMVLVTGLLADTTSAALVLLLGWLGIAGYLALFGATLYRQYIATRRATRAAAPANGAFPALVSIAAIIGALTLADLVQRSGPAAGGDPADASVVAASPAPEAAAPVGGAQPAPVSRTAGNSAAYRAEEAQKKREREIAEAALIVGGTIGFEVGQEQARQDMQAEQAAADAQAAARDAAAAANSVPPPRAY